MTGATATRGGSPRPPPLTRRRVRFADNLPHYEPQHAAAGVAWPFAKNQTLHTHPVDPITFPTPEDDGDWGRGAPEREPARATEGQSASFYVEDSPGRKSPDSADTAADAIQIPLTPPVMPPAQRYVCLAPVSPHAHRRRRPAYLSEYSIGDEGSPRDMAGDSSDPRLLTLAASRLRELDGAFVLRSDLRWTYAVVVRVILPKETVDDDNIQSCQIEFIVSKAGATKNVSYGRWASGVRAIRHPDGEEVDEFYYKLRS
ncbi:hypothetical protein THAOC_06756 [Thalassiosira oceanica]|uniref:Uncharacterized protein n=1 Tax=Thalassiosira oceanica TaxID=159749 RepID=K0T1Y5_THAOC|nr:hypothetical protein THAOC_06756 [Thalassiosira oceanica]|mmetsp:Transcript_24715/g.58656  ORF Transcript_24715/g.58656 Transcript_24715/m.58656 type:complete len:258 (-) Transcript_24715:45-818(-)|eukprot:EJK71775.1 hypothetical protein THAOC_06756 [Thalassiosira oceanica]